jgi:hypothetical protein
MGLEGAGGRENFDILGQVSGIVFVRPERRNKDQDRRA